MYQEQCSAGIGSVKYSKAVQCTAVQYGSAVQFSRGQYSSVQCAEAVDVLGQISCVD